MSRLSVASNCAHTGQIRRVLAADHVPVGSGDKWRRRPKALLVLAPQACRHHDVPGCSETLHGWCQPVSSSRAPPALGLGGHSAAATSLVMQRRRARTCSATDAAVAALTNESLITPFTWTNSAITYAWLLLILAPRWEVTKAIFKPDAVVVLWCCSFLYFFVTASMIDSSSPEDLSAKVIFLFTEAITDPSKMATLATPAYIAQDWVHVLVWDFVVGRYIWLEALEQDLPVRHSLLSIFALGPIGLIVHLITKAVVEAWRKQQPQQPQP